MHSAPLAHLTVTNAFGFWSKKRSLETDKSVELWQTIFLVILLHPIENFKRTRISRLPREPSWSEMHRDARHRRECFAVL
jgi:hypothetical protein